MDSNEQESYQNCDEIVIIMSDKNSYIMRRKENHVVEREVTRVPVKSREERWEGTDERSVNGVRDE